MVAINVILLPECTGEGCGGDNEICTDSRVHHHNAESRAPVTRNHRGAPSPGRWMEQNPTQYINGANTYQFANSSPVGTVDAEGLRALPGVQKSVLVRKEDIGRAYENKRRWEDRRQGHQIHYR